jgi:hypothetical protein
MPRRVDPITTENSPLYGAKRQLVLAAFTRLNNELHDLDQQLHAIAKRRREITQQLRQHRRRLWSIRLKHGRCPLPDGRYALPPTRHDAVGLWGRRLRSHCRDLLKRHGGPLELVEIHALLHHGGYFIQSGSPVKALSEALRYEVSLGRVSRVERGIYQLT